MQLNIWKNKLAGAVLASLTVTALIAGSPTVVQAQSAMVRGLPDFTELVEQVGPSVVNIRTLEKVKTNAANAGPSDDEMQELFRRFFGVPMPLSLIHI